MNNQNQDQNQNQYSDQHHDPNPFPRAHNETRPGVRYEATFVDIVSSYISRNSDVDKPAAAEEMANKLLPDIIAHWEEGFRTLGDSATFFQDLALWFWNMTRAMIRVAFARPQQKTILSKALDYPPDIVVVWCTSILVERVGSSVFELVSDDPNVLAPISKIGRGI
jgi:hypothetical protein